MPWQMVSILENALPSQFLNLQNIRYMSFWNREFTFWRNLLTQWQEKDALPLSANAHDIQLSLFCAESLKEDADPKHWYAQICLFESEEKAWQSLHAGPDFDVSVVDKVPEIRWTIRRLTLLEVSQDVTLLERLKRRLEHIADYAYQDLPASTEWYWYQEGGNLINIAWVDGRYFAPQPSNAIEARDLPFRFHHYALVYDELGLAGIMAESGCVLPCQYSYLRAEFHGHKQFIAEASMQELPDTGYYRVCDLLDQDGRQVNPPELQVLSRSGSTVYHTYVVQKQGAGPEDLYGYLKADGSLLGDIAWRAVRKFGLRYGRVQCPDSEYWGYLDESGQLVIQPQFSHVGDFNNGQAFVRDAQGLAGIINRQGDYVIAPQWRDIDSFEDRFWLVENLQGEIGVLDESAQVVVEFRPKVTVLQPGHRFWLSHQIDEQQLAELKAAVAGKLDTQWASLLQGQTQLGIMRGKLQNGEGAKALARAGLWGQSVRVLIDIPQRGLTKGASGRIGWDYPNTAANYDLSVECPVRGLVADRQYDVGIAWESLELLGGTLKSNRFAQLIDFFMTVWRNWFTGFRRL